MIEECIDGSNLKVSHQLRPHLAKILWLYQMGIIFYWTNDISKNPHKTARLTTLSLQLLVRLLRVSALPVLRSINRSAI